MSTCVVQQVFWCHATVTLTAPLSATTHDAVLKVAQHSSGYRAVMTWLTVAVNKWGFLHKI